jgi:hypothetical protein
MSAGLPSTGQESNGRNERTGLTLGSTSGRNAIEKENATRGTMEGSIIGDGFGNTEVKRLSRGSAETSTASSILSS